MIRTYVQPARLKPAQHRRLDALLHQLTDLWNAALQERIECYRKTGKSVSYYDQCKSLTVIRGDDESFAAFPVMAQRTPLNRLDKAFKAFFRRVKAGEKPGFPRFKSRHRGIHSFELGTPSVCRKGKWYALSVKGIGDIRFAVLPSGQVRQARIVRSALRTSVHLVVELPDVEGAALALPVGIDVGIRSRCAISTGEVHQGVRIDRRRVRQAQRLLTRAQKGSRSRVKKRQALAKAYERVQISERNALHRLTTAIVRRHNCIAVEDLRIPNMVQNGRLARSIHEQQWGRLVTQLTYKAESAGGSVVRVDPKCTSMTCSSCGHAQVMPLGVREFRCEDCGLVTDRDVNAARNILSRGITAAGWDVEAVVTPLRPGASGDICDRYVAGLPGQDAELCGGTRYQPDQVDAKSAT